MKERKMGHQSKEEGKEHFNAITTFTMTSTTTYLGKEQMRD